MKQVLIIDESPLFREYLRNKLEENSIEVGIGISAMDGISKMHTLAPDLIILDYHLSRQGSMEVLKHKKSDVNTVNAPVIILAGKIDQNQLINMIPYNVKKVFNKPIKADALLSTISEILGADLAIDESPSIVEVHANDNIIFIEIAKGLNRDKLDLLRFKIVELIELYEINIPKVILMLSDIKLGFADTSKMQKLLTTIIEASGVKLRYMRVLTNDDFVRQFIMGKNEYFEMEVVTNLQNAIDGLLALDDSDLNEAGKKAEIIGDRILQAMARESSEDMVLKFDTEAKNVSLELMKNSLKNLKIAVVDDDIIILEMVKNTFSKTGADVFTYSGGTDFLKVSYDINFDLVFLDLNMPVMDGFQVLSALKNREIHYPIIILSANSQREVMIKTIQMGVRSYLIKPLKPEEIFRKSLEILKSNF